MQTKCLTLETIRYSEAPRITYIFLDNSKFRKSRMSLNWGILSTNAKIFYFHAFFGKFYGNRVFDLDNYHTPLMTYIFLGNHMYCQKSNPPLRTLGVRTQEVEKTSVDSRKKRTFTNIRDPRAIFFSLFYWDK